MATIRRAVYKLSPTGPASFMARDAPEGLPLKWQKGSVYETSDPKAIAWLDANPKFTVVIEEAPSPQPVPEEPKAAPKEAEPKKAAPKKAAPKTSTKSASKKSAPKKAPAKKSAPKK